MKKLGLLLVIFFSTWSEAGVLDSIGDIISKVEHIVTKLTEQKQKNKQPEPGVTCSPGKITGNSFGAFCTNPGKNPQTVKIDVLCVRPIDQHVNNRSQEFNLPPGGQQYIAVNCYPGEEISEGNIY